MNRVIFINLCRLTSKIAFTQLSGGWDCMFRQASVRSSGQRRGQEGSGRGGERRWMKRVDSGLKPVCGLE